jgi:competence ComEA-like helix-hairpin-helix protein
MENVLLIAGLLFVLSASALQPVEINNASVEQIALLPGIGKKLAENIVAFRKKHGPIRRAEQLLDVSKMTPGRLNQIRKHLLFSSAQTNIKGTQIAKMIPLAKNPIVDLPALEQEALNAENLSVIVDDAFFARARKAAWLPTLTTYFDTDHGEIATKKINDPKDPILRRGGREYSMGIKVSFNFDKLIFNPEELEIAKLAVKRAEQRQATIDKLHKTYFSYISLAATLIDPADTQRRSMLQGELQVLGAKLNFMTNGAFSRRNESSGHQGSEVIQ